MALNRDVLRSARIKSKNFFNEYPLTLDLDIFLNTNGYKIEAVIGSKLDQDKLKKCVQLCCENMQKYYNDSCFINNNTNEIGWSDASKMKEIKNWSANILLIEDDRSIEDLIGFIHFRFTTSEVTDFERFHHYAKVFDMYSLIFDFGKGLGKLLMKYLDNIAKISLMQQILCTVQNSNERALRFYTRYCEFKVQYRSGFITMNETSNHESESNEKMCRQGYIILCKVIKN